LYPVRVFWFADGFSFLDVPMVARATSSAFSSCSLCRMSAFVRLYAAFLSPSLVCMRTTDLLDLVVTVSNSMLLLDPFDRLLGSPTDLFLCFIDGDGWRWSVEIFVPRLACSKCVKDNECVSK
jgi:hypothetical protein